METLTEMFDRIIHSETNMRDRLTPAFSDVKFLLRAQTDVKRRAFDKGAQAHASAWVRSSSATCRTTKCGQATLRAG